MSIWDAITRLWHVPRTWLALRRPITTTAAVMALVRTEDPARFVRRAMVPAAGSLALALAWLPGRRRLEAEVTLLAGMALREIDRRAAVEAAALARLGTPDGASGRDRVRAAVGFLTGQAPGPQSREPRAREPRRRGDLSRFDDVRGVLASRLATLRAAIESLPGDAVRRCRAMIEQLGDSVIHDRIAADTGAPGADTVGEAVMYAMRLAAPWVRPPDATCRAVGRALELVSALEAESTFDGRGMPPAGSAAEGPRGLIDGGPDARVRRDRLRARAINELSHVPRLARWLPGRVGGGVRAAAALLITSECARLLQILAPKTARRLHAMRAALSAARSRKAYLAVIDRAIETVVAASPALAAGTLDTRRAPSPSPASLAGGPVVSPMRITINTPARGTQTPRAPSPTPDDLRR